MKKLDIIINIPFTQEWTKDQCLQFMNDLDANTLRHLVSSQLYDENSCHEEYQNETLRIYKVAL